jgi:hypothetical protein
MAKKVTKRRSPMNQRVTSSRLIRRSTTSTVALGSYESRKKQKLIAREVMAVSPATPEYLKWSEVSITFDCNNHSDFVPKPGRYPLIVSPIIKDVNLNQVLVNGGSSLNIFFLKTFDKIGLPRSALRPSRAPFHDIVPRAAETPVDQITLSLSLSLSIYIYIYIYIYILKSRNIARVMN